jgi:AraC-like DNA-binding protein
MLRLAPGEFYGGTLHVRRYAGLTLTLSTYTPDQAQAWHMHANPTFFLLISGDHRDVTRRYEWHQPPLTLTFHSTTELHAAEVGPAGMVGLNVEYDQRWLEQHDLTLQPLENGPLPDSAHSGLMALRFLDAAFREGVMAEADIETLAIELMEPLFPISIDIPAHPRWLRQAEDFLHERFSLPISLRDVAREVGVHPVYLARVFRRQHGCSVSGYLRALRLAEAGRLILKGWSIGAAAHEAGFSDHAHLSRSFARDLHFHPRALSPVRTFLSRN